VYKDWSVYGNPTMVDWRSRGYFAYLEEAPQASATGGNLLPQAAHWLQWLEALHHARSGDFSLIPRLLEIIPSDTHPVTRRLCAELVGDAGPDSCIDAVADRTAKGMDDDFEVTLSWCRVLTRRAKLADIPVVLDAFERVADIQDAGIIPILISDCLDSDSELSDPDEFDSLQGYKESVQRRCHELAEQLGTDQALVVYGGPFGVVRLAELILVRLREPDFPEDLRRRFEVATGIDCASFHLDRQFQPLRAAALIEAFLEDPGVSRYRDGERYFFGHLIPR
jgi:hypothetical protein